jgi:predicted ATP-grasp superfamily ATP-dependent carboligase
VNLLIVGISTRAAAASAAAAGFAVSAIDAFADLDQHPSVSARSLGRDFTAHAAARAAQDVRCDAVVYLSNLEKQPKAKSTLAAKRELLGNPPDVVRRVRNPLILAEALRKRGMATPEVRLTPDTASQGDGRRWVIKPLSSGGGQRVRLWEPGSDLPRHWYLQELIEGVSGSVVFVAAARRAVPLAVSRQLIGDRAFGADGYQYCGSILEIAPLEDGPDFPHHEAFIRRACALAHAVTQEFDLVGLNGIDFVAHQGTPYAVEVNPRWCASMELAEHAYGVSTLGSHVAACTTGALPDFDLTSAQRRRSTNGKGVVYARRDVTVRDTQEWLADSHVRDVPRPGERIIAQRPVCSVFATGPDARACHAALVRRAASVYDRLAAWE